jgi:leader peptidase (prepilin peptidase) / N-methyltransferase
VLVSNGVRVPHGPRLGAVTAVLDPSAARALATIMAGLVGLLIGSFLNVVVYRVPRGLSIVSPGSFCPVCKTPVRPFDNVPIASWLALGRRCRSCRTPISARYPLVEGLTGVVFATVALAVGPHLAVPGLCTLAATFVAMAAIALDHEPSPASVALVGAGIGWGLLLAAAAVHDTWASVVAGGISGVVALGVVALAGNSEETGSRAACLVPLAVLLGWLGPGAPVASVSGVAVTGVLTGALVWFRHRSARNGEEVVWWLLPPAVAVGAAAAFAVAAVVGGTAGT